MAIKSDAVQVRGKNRVSKMPGSENPSDAQAKYHGPEPLLRQTKSCNSVPIDGRVVLDSKVEQEGLSYSW